MEQSEAFKELVAFSKDLEQRVKECDEASKSVEKMYEGVHGDIERHFAKCLSILAARKASLLAEVESKLKAQKKELETIKVNLQKSSESCKEILRAGSVVFGVSKNIAETMWKEGKFLPCAEVSLKEMKAKLPDSFFTAIQDHGKIVIGEDDINEAYQIVKKDVPGDTFVDEVSTVAGSTAGYADGEGKQAQFSGPSGIFFCPNDDCLYVCDSTNGAIRKITRQGVVHTFVGKGRIYRPTAIVKFHKENTLFVVSSFGLVIYKINSVGDVTVFAGKDKTPGFMDGNGANARFQCPEGIAIDRKTGNMFVTDSSAIKKISPKMEVTTLAGSQVLGFADGIGRLARFNRPEGIFFDEVGQTLLVCDCGNNRLRRVSLNGEVSTVCSINQPTSVVVTLNRTILVCSFIGNNISQVTQKDPGIYEAKVIAGTGVEESVDGKALQCSFAYPMGLAFDESSQSCFVADYWGNRIRKLSFTK